MPPGASVPSNYADDVFINCPFDADFQPILHAIIFTVIACGFRPRTAMEEANGADVRLDKICRLIDACMYGIHDISHMKLDPNTAMPRFNMPFELGVDYAARRFGSKHRNKKKIVVLAGTQFDYRNCLSDISGQDIKSHGNDPAKATKAVRDWLNTESGRSGIPGQVTIARDFAKFSADLPALCAVEGLDDKDLHYVDFVRMATAFNKLQRSQ